MASRILLADDSITIQKVVNLTFADEGIEVVAVSNGDVAERRLAEVKPDLVLADIFMPGKNGYELCEAIKESVQFRNVPVVLLVGAFEPFDQAEARRVRADAHLTKPFESRTLVETVRRLISASPRTTTGPIAPPPVTDDERVEALDSHAPGAAPAPMASPLAGKLDFAAMMVDAPISTPAVRNTGELASPAPDPRQDVFDRVFSEAPPMEAISATLTDTRERFEPLEFSPNGSFSPADMAQSFSLDGQEPVQDFDAPAAVELPMPQEPISFETQSTTEAEKDERSAAAGEGWFNRTSADTTNLNTPPADGQWHPRATGAPLGYQSPDFSLQTEATLSTSEASTETACATLLAVDEPLGDVLFDEADSVPPLGRAESPSDDALGLEFMEAEVAEAAPPVSTQPVSTQFALVETVAEPSPEPTSAPEEDVSVLESLVADEIPSSGDVLELPSPSPLSDAPPVSHDFASDLDWTTPRAAAYSTAQLDSVVMPIAAAEYLAENAVHDAPEPETKEEASFTAPAMWTEEEARFSPIDIEAVSVEEASQAETNVVETGFAFAPVPPEPSDSGSETTFEPATNGHSDTSSAVLSSAAIEEIVRRVVAEMSESVVREVAWEVVPDCVERVIEQLTRESLSKRA